jgi:hypothetical protein
MVSAACLTAALLPAGVAAQPRPAANAASRVEVAAPQAGDEQTARETRDRLHQILEQYPPSVGQVLRLDPSLLARADYMASYPTLAAYLAQHPEIGHNPVFFLGGVFSGQQYDSGRPSAVSAVQDVFIGLEVLLGIVTAIITLAWLARAAIEHRRWLRATRIQTDAHNKIVDRLSSNEDLLAYMQSATGQRFLTASFGGTVPEIAPAPIVSAPFNRILWSVQVGIVVAAAGFGLWLAKNGVIEEVAQPLQVISILAIALGVGFVVSAFASYAMSRQLGLVQPQQPHA